LDHFNLQPFKYVAINLEVIRGQLSTAHGLLNLLKTRQTAMEQGG
jgi:hypothetical protein